VLIGTARLRAGIHFVVEAWARKTNGKLALTMLINRTPITGKITIYRNNDKPYRRPRRRTAMTSGSTSPRRTVRSHRMVRTRISKLSSMKFRMPSRPRISGFLRRRFVLEHLDEAIAHTSGNGEYIFGERQLFYQIPRRGGGHALPRSM
jgi:hypothetical protein